VVTWLLKKLLRRSEERMAHDIQANLRFLPMSAQKVRLVVDLVRGKDANTALEMLRFVPKAAAVPVRKLLASAVANAEENFGVSRDDLYVAKIYADEAPTRKWRRFGARGRFKPILRRNSHVTVVLRERGS
jgi:large subunit ribosomal protein L22